VLGEILVDMLRKERGIDERESFIDATVAAAKEGRCGGIHQSRKGLKIFRDCELARAAALREYACG
jgi:hypothetical protein